MNGLFNWWYFIETKIHQLLFIKDTAAGVKTYPHLRRGGELFKEPK